MRVSASGDRVRRQTSDLGMSDEQSAAEPDAQDSQGEDPDSPDGDQDGEAGSEGEPSAMEGGDQQDAGEHGEEMEAPLEDGDKSYAIPKFMAFIDRWRSTLDR